MKRRDFLISSACATGITISAALVQGDSPKAVTDGQQGDPRRAATGPLRVHPTNRRYFTDGSGRAVYLTGSHTWGSLQDGGVVDPPPAFDFTAYLNFLEKNQHNFIRLRRVEPTRASWDNNPARYYAPHPWPRTSPGNAADGKPKFDLSQFNDVYFDRLRTRVVAPVGMTSQGYGGGDDSEILLNSDADWVSPNPDKYDYRKNPPASDGGKVILLDTDHLPGLFISR